MNLVSIPLTAPFLDTLATGWLARPASDDLSNGLPSASGAGQPSASGAGLILLPTRRAARSLAAAFLRVGGGRAMLLPRITAIGALDEAPLALAGALDLPPAIEPMPRLAALAKLILALPEAAGAKAADGAWMLARELASLMDEAERAERPLHAALQAAAHAEHAAHWEITLRFLNIVTHTWPDYLRDQGLMNPAERQTRLLRRQAEAWTDKPPPYPVWIAGTTGAIPAVARLVAAVARLPDGLVILPGLDFSLSDAAWDKLEATHPQAGLQRLLLGLGASRADVQEWQAAPLASNTSPVPESRRHLLTQALLPAEALDAWQSEQGYATTDLHRLDPADQQEEAVGIALILRDALQIPGARAALVTPDRGLAARVAAELLRWGVVADDSAGEPLAETPPAVFLRLMARAVADHLAPVPLLSLLKHPFAAAGSEPAACRLAARALERAALRGPRPTAGIAGLRRAAQESPESLDFLAAIEACLEPLLRAVSGVAVPPVDLLDALIRAAEALAGTPEASGPARLWALEEGEALAELLTGARAALAMLPDQNPVVLPGLLDALLQGAVVRSRRALRGRESLREHPRLFIWGLLEARLQAVDVMVLGGLTEGTWPPSTDPGPWMSRPMRTRAGLPDPEEAIGQAAHDFVSAACAAPRAVLSAPRRRDAAPSVPARWLARIDALLKGRKQALPHHPAATWARLLDQPSGSPRPVHPPTPRPAVALRPRSLSVTQIETWLIDPYAIYARHVLRLRPLDPLEQETDASDYGSLVHAGLHAFLQKFPDSWPPDARVQLGECLDSTLRAARLRPALTEWWAPRFRRIADWVVEQEITRRSEHPPAQIAGEIKGSWQLGVRNGFELTGRADRIERRRDGTLAILDFKTGTLPTQSQVDAGLAPQLPLEAAMAAAGGFGPTLAGQVTELTYWHLTGGYIPGEVFSLFKAEPTQTIASGDEAAARLRELVIAFDDPARAYLSQPHPDRIPRFPQYAQLARVAEWDLAGDGGEDAP